jgi:PmbA protein
MEKEELSQQCSKILNIAEKLNVTQFEVYGIKKETLSIEFEKGEAKIGYKGSIIGFATRCIIDGKIGFSTTNDIEKLEELVKLSISSAKTQTETKKIKEFPQPETPTKVNGIYDKRLVETDSSGLTELLSAIVQEASNNKKVEAVSGRIDVEIEERVVTNLNNLEVTDKGTFLSAMVFVKVKEKDDVGSGYEIHVSRKLDVNPDKLGSSALKNALQNLGKEKIESGIYTVIFEPSALSSLLGFVLIPAFYADSIATRASFLSEKLGKQVFSEKINIIDDGTLEEGVCSYSFDDEGIPTERKTLVEKGILKNLLYDHATALLNNVESTGNAIRYDWWYGRSYKYPPKISALNFIIEGQIEPLDHIIQDIRHGVLIRDIVGGHSSKVASGEFSITVTNGLLIENGEIKKPITRAIISGTIQETLNKLECLAGDIKTYPMFGTAACLMSPCLVFKETKITT